MRTINPREDNERAVQESAGFVPPRELVRRQNESQRFRGDAPPPVIYETLTWFRANIGGSGDDDYLGRVAWPSGDAAWAMGALPLLAPAQGRIVVVRLWSAEAITAGTVQAQIQVTEGSDTTDEIYEEVELDAAVNSRQAVAVFPWSIARQFSAGATLEGRFLTAGSMTPTSADVVMQVTVGYEQWK